MHGKNDTNCYTLLKMSSDTNLPHSAPTDGDAERAPRPASHELREVDSPHGTARTTASGAATSALKARLKGDDGSEPDDTELTEAEENASDFVSELEQYIGAS